MLRPNDVNNGNQWKEKWLVTYTWFIIPNTIQQQMKKQIVSIDFKEDQGVILSWNYSDLFRKCKYYRHILILLSSKIEEAKPFIKNYIKSIKPGDLFTTIYKTHSNSFKINDWRQKTYNHHLALRNYINSESIQIFNIQQGLQFLQNSLQQINEPSIINFLVEKQEHVAELQKRIKIYQKDKKMNFINTIFSPRSENTISVNEGINLLNVRDPEVFNFYHQYINQVVAEYAHLTITCKNGQLGSCVQTDWTNTAFNKIERYYYAPTVKYTKDILHIINTRIIYSGSYELVVNLSFKCFNGVVYNSEKKIVINFDHSEFYNRTVAIPRKKRPFVTADDVQFEESPYQSETLVSFQKEIKGTGADI